MLPSEPKERYAELRIGESRTAQRERTDAALEQLAQEANGHVVIGLKPAGAKRSRETGWIPANDRAGINDARRALVAQGVEVIRAFQSIPALSVRIRPGTVRALRTLPFVDYISPSVSMEPAQVPPPQDTGWGVKRVLAPQVWTGVGGNPPTHGDPDVMVVILDSGMDETHRTSANGDLPTGVCLYVAAAGPNCYDDQVHSGLRGHGAHVAGIVAAKNNTIGVIGMSPGVTLVSIKIANSAGQYLSIPIADALDWVIQTGWNRRIVNMSFKSCLDVDIIRNTIAAAHANGVLLVAAAGNEYPGYNEAMACPEGSDLPNASESVHGVTWPARYEQVIAVSGVDGNDQFVRVGTPPAQPTGSVNDPSNDGDPQDVDAASTHCRYPGSRYGPQVDIAAPWYAKNLWANGTYYLDCGTSMAAPHVAGAAALIWSLYPTWTAADVRARLLESAVDRYDPYRYGQGIVNVFKAAYFQTPYGVSAVIAGTETAPVDGSCHFIAGSDVPEPRFYQWAVDSGTVGTGATLDYAASSGYTLQLAVWNQTASAGAWKSVDVSEQYTSCATERKVRRPPSR